MGNWPTPYSCKLMEAGIISYEDSGAGIAYLTKQTIDKIAPSIIGKPVVIRHQKVTPENHDKVAVGYVTGVRFDPVDAWFYVDFLITSDDVEAIDRDGCVVFKAPDGEILDGISGAYDVTNTADGGVWHDIKFDAEILDGSFTHLALVVNPRYEETNKIREANFMLVNGKAAKQDAKGNTIHAVENATMTQYDAVMKQLKEQPGSALNVRTLVKYGEVLGFTANTVYEDLLSCGVPMQKALEEVRETWRRFKMNAKENEVDMGPYITAHLKRAKEAGRDPVEYLKSRFGHTKSEAEYLIKKYGGDNSMKNSKADRIEQIDCDILDAHNKQSGRDLLQFKDEFLSKVRAAGISSISKAEADELENDNYHTALEILMTAGMVQKKADPNMNAKDTDVFDVVHRDTGKTVGRWTWRQIKDKGIKGDDFIFQAVENAITADLIRKVQKEEEGHEAAAKELIRIGVLLPLEYSKKHPELENAKHVSVTWKNKRGGSSSFGFDDKEEAQAFIDKTKKDFPDAEFKVETVSRDNATSDAYAAGQKAFKRGIQCAPALDQEFMKTFAGREVGDARSVPEMEAWIRGWTNENLANSKDNSKGGTMKNLFKIFRKIMNGKEEEGSDKIVDVEGTEVPLSELVKTYEAEEAEKAEKAKLDAENAKKSLQMAKDEDEVEVGGKKVKVADLKNCYAAKNKKNAKTDEEKAADEKKAKEEAEAKENEKRNAEEKEKAEKEAKAKADEEAKNAKDEEDKKAAEAKEKEDKENSKRLLENSKGGMHFFNTLENASKSFIDEAEAAGPKSREQQAETGRQRYGSKGKK